MSEKKPDIWMPLYVADYQADTAYLTTEHHGAYLLMLMAYWRNGPIPDNNGIIAAITRQPPDAWSITRAVLEPFFQVRDGFWFHKRVEQEYDKARKNRAVHHDRAVKAAKARWDKENAQAMLQALPEDMPMQCPSPSPSPSQITTQQEQSATPPVADAPPMTAPVGSKKAVGQKRVKSEVTLTDWLTALGDEDAIPAEDTLLSELDAAGVPDEFVALAWAVFKRDWANKKAKDWRATFRDAIRRGWVRIWYFDQSTGECRLNQAGELARRTLAHG